MGIYEGTPGDDVFRTQSSTLIIIPVRAIYSRTAMFTWAVRGQRRPFASRASTFDLPDLLEATDDIFGGADNDTLIFAPPHDFPGLIDVTFYGDAGTDSAYLNFQPMGALDVDFTNFGPGMIMRRALVSSKISSVAQNPASRRLSVCRRNVSL